MKNPYQSFSRFVLRTPLKSFSEFDNISKDEIISSKKLKTICSSPQFKEALFLASPELFDSFEKWLNSNGRNSEKNLRMRNTILKYLSRMSSRCTPFGLFAGTSVGSFSKENIIHFKEIKPRRHTRLDMNYLVALTLDISKRDGIRNKLRFYPNTSIYKLGGDLRYIEYTYIESMRQHHIVAVKETSSLTSIIEKASSGALYNELVTSLIDDEISHEDSKKFVNELIEGQLLVSELEPSVCGDEFTIQLLDIIKNIPKASEIYKVLIEVQKRLRVLDEKIGNPVKEYANIALMLQTLGVDFDRKFLFQTDLVPQPKINMLDQSIPKKVQRVMGLLNKITIVQQETKLSKFAEAFYERYQEQEVPLSKVMDSDLGIGFDQSNGNGDMSAIIDDIKVPSRRIDDGVITEQTNPIDRVILKKLKEVTEKGEEILELTYNDFEDQVEVWTDLPDTLSIMVELVKIQGEDKIMFRNLGGSSGANLLGRFCHGDECLHSFVSEIIKVEDQMALDSILAEIVHLPESRMGNILMRPSFRAYEIPFLATSNLPKEQQILIEDLVLKVSSQKKVILKSKQHNKRVFPRLTNAHNYSGKTLPTYQCLASLQHPEGRSGLGFGWPKRAQNEIFLPRVIFEDCILSPKTWNLRREHLKVLMEANENSAIEVSSRYLFAKALKEFKSTYNLPEYILFKEGDNELVVRLTNHSSVKMFINAVGNSEAIKIIEFLHQEPGIVKNGDGHFTNQVIMTFYNNNKLNRSKVND